MLQTASLVAAVAVLLANSASGHAPRTTGWQKGATPEGVTAFDVGYEIDGLSYTGYVAFPTAAAGVVPGTMIAHQVRDGEMRAGGFFPPSLLPSLPPVVRARRHGEDACGRGSATTGLW